MAQPFLGELRCVPFNFAPVGWALAEGQILPIAQYTALFSLLGTTYGGNGTTTFALPDLRGRVPASFGQGAGLMNYTLGETVGVEKVTLTTGELPAHNHMVNASANKGSHASPIGAYPASDAAGVTAEYGLASTGTMNAGVISSVGSGQPIENRQPTLILNWIIATAGIFPSRN